MPIVVQLRHATFTEPGSQAALTAMAAIHELVLIGAHHVMPVDGLSQLRQAIAPRHMVALLIDDYLPGTERTLIDELLNDGTIPVILTQCDPPPSALTSWLNAADPTVRQVPARRVAHRRGGPLLTGPSSAKDRSWGVAAKEPDIG